MEIEETSFPQNSRKSSLPLICPSTRRISHFESKFSMEINPPRWSQQKWKVILLMPSEKHLGWRKATPFQTCPLSTMGFKRERKPVSFKVNELIRKRYIDQDDKRHFFLLSYTLQVTIVSPFEPFNVKNFLQNTPVKNHPMMGQLWRSGLTLFEEERWERLPYAHLHKSFCGNFRWVLIEARSIPRWRRAFFSLPKHRYLLLKPSWA